MERLKVGSLFSGYGGLDLAVESFFDAEVAWNCEFDANPSRILEHRFPGVPNLGDITKVNWSKVEPVDIITGGSPCQDLSAAGRRGGMTEGTRSNLWVQMREAIDALQPSIVIWENVRGAYSAHATSDVEHEPGLLGEPYSPDRPALRALHRVLGDFASLGFDAEWGVIRASDVGAPHGRARVFVVAYRRSSRLNAWRQSASRQAPSGRASSFDRGRGGAPVALLPTPVAQPSGNTPEDHLRKKPGREVVTDLAILVENRMLETGGRLMPTPKAGDADFATPSTSGRPVERSTHLGTIAMLQAGQLEHRKLLPTPSAMSPNEEEDLELWEARRQRVKADKQNGNGFGTPLGIAVRQLPTPRATRGGSTTEISYLFGGERTDEGDAQGNVVIGEVSWGEYEPAVRRWEAVTRPAPEPTRPDGKNGSHRLSPEFTQWLMGLPDGWLTDPAIWEGMSASSARNAQIKACGNGVVPQQAFEAIRQLWQRVERALAE